MPSGTYYIGSDADDGYWRSDNFFLAVGTTYLQFGDNTNDYHFFGRFSNVTIPAGAEITSAYIRVYANFPLSQSDIIYSKLHFEASDDAVAPTSFAEAEALSLTTGTDWDITSGSWTNGNWYNSVDIKSELQEVIDRGGWSPNNAVMVVCKDDGSLYSQQRYLADYYANSGFAMELHAEWITPVSGDLSEGVSLSDVIDCEDPYAEIDESMSMDDAMIGMNTTCEIAESFSVSGIVGGEEDGETPESFSSDDAVDGIKEQFAEPPESLSMDDAVGVETEVVLPESMSLDDTHQTEIETGTSEGLSADDAAVGNTFIYPLVNESGFFYEQLGWTWRHSVESTAEFSDEVEVEIIWGLHDWIEALDQVGAQWTGGVSVESKIQAYDHIIWAWRETIESSATVTDAVLADTQWHLEDGISMVEAVSSQWTGGLTVTDGIACYDVPVWTWSETLESTAEAVGAAVADITWPLADGFTIEGVSGAKWVGALSLTDSLYISGQSILIQVFNETATSEFQMADTSSCLHQLVSTLTSTINAGETVSSQVTFNPTIVEAIAISGVLSLLLTIPISQTDAIEATDSALWGWRESLSDSFAAVDTLTLQWCAIHVLTSNIALTEAAAAVLSVDETLSDVLEMATTLAMQKSIFPVIEDTLQFDVTVLLAGEVWQCWVLNTNRFDVSVYSNYDFNSYAVFNGQAFGCKSDGIYLLDGDTDDGDAINPGIVLPATTFGTSHKKRFRKAYFGLSGTSPSIRMETDSGNVTYNITNSKANIGRKQKGREWTVKVQGFDDMDFIELIPILLTR